jgi:hypothetical protein
VAQKAVELARSVRDPRTQDYIADDSVRELVVYALEEIEQFCLRELSQESDPDECLLKIKEMRTKVMDEIKELDAKAQHPLDVGRIEGLIDRLISDAVKVVSK